MKCRLFPESSKVFGLRFITMVIPVSLRNRYVVTMRQPAPCVNLNRNPVMILRPFNVEWLELPLAWEFVNSLRLRRCLLIRLQDSSAGKN